MIEDIKRSVATFGNSVLPALRELMRETQRDEPPASLLLADLIYAYQWVMCLPGPITHAQALFLQALDDLKNSFEGIPPTDVSDASTLRIWTVVLDNTDHQMALEQMHSTRPLSVALLERYDDLHQTSHAPAMAQWLLDTLRQSAVDYPAALQRLRLWEENLTPLSNPTGTSTRDALTDTTEVTDKQTAEELLLELDALVGLEPVKAEVISLVNVLRINQMRQERGFPALEVTKHMVFYGNPGTGKTTVARLVAKILKALGILKKGHLVETDRSGLVAAYVGQTALKVKKMVNIAQDGVLFIDEAYSLARGESDFGSEAIDALLKLMEDRRDSLVVIVAGYTEKMQHFINSNPGLKSRFTRFLEFPDYAASELFDIFERMLGNAGMRLAPEAVDVAKQAFAHSYQNKGEQFGNARFARTLFEQSTVAQANRLASFTTLSNDDLAILTKDDIVQTLRVNNTGF